MQINRLLDGANQLSRESSNRSRQIDDLQQRTSVGSAKASLSFGSQQFDYEEIKKFINDGPDGRYS